MRCSSLVVAAALIPHTTYAWGVVGHEVIATIAQMHLHPTVMPKLCAILDFPEGKCHLAPVAAWADKARSQSKYRWTGPLHYIGAVDDYPRDRCAFPGPQGAWLGRTHINVLHAIRNTTNVLQEFEALRASAGLLIETDTETDTELDVPYYVQDALKFLIHFVGDMHMPLHLTGRNRGGNDDKVKFEGRTTNLHSVWDSRLISERIRTLPGNYTRPLPLPEVESLLRGTIYDPYIRRLVWEGFLGKWHDDDLDAWLLCPAASSARHPSPPHASTWQSVLSLFAPTGTRETEDDGGLGVDDDAVCPYAWAKPIHQLNCDVVYPEAFDALRVYHAQADDDVGCSCGGEAVSGDAEEDAYDEDDEDDDVMTLKKSSYLELYTHDYVGMIKKEWIVETLLTQAGIRLAAVLNWIYAEPEDLDTINKRRYYLSL